MRPSKGRIIDGFFYQSIMFPIISKKELSKRKYKTLTNISVALFYLDIPTLE